MKKIFVLIFIVLLVLVGLFFGIKKFYGNKATDIQFVNKFKSESIMNIGEKVYGCELFHTDSLTEITLQDPKTVEGIKITWENGNQKVSLDGIQKETNYFMIPEDSFLNLVVKILNSINSLELTKLSNDGKYSTFKGKIDKHEFEFTADDNGYIKELSIPLKKSKISFEYKENI